MDDAIANLEVREASGLVELDEENLREFEEKGFITESASIVEKLEQMEAGATSNTGPFISEDFLKGLLEFESEDLLEILEMESESAGGPGETRQRLSRSIGESEMNDSLLRSMPTARPGTEDTTLEEAEAWVLDQEETDSEFKEWAKQRRMGISNEPRGLQALVESAEPSYATDGKWSQPTLGGLPAHTKKPGYELRVMRMESEMSRIVAHTLAFRYPEWCSSGAGIVEVALSPNMRDLTVFYDIAEEKLKEKGWAKMLKQITKGVRSEIAKLDIRYAPRVHFQCGQPSDSRQHEALDDIFAQIAKERELVDTRRSG